MWYIRQAPLILTLFLSFFVGGVVSEFVQATLPASLFFISFSFITHPLTPERSGRHSNPLTSSPISSARPSSSTSLTWPTNVTFENKKSPLYTNPSLQVVSDGTGTLKGESTLSTSRPRQVAAAAGGILPVVSHMRTQARVGTNGGDRGGRVRSGTRKVRVRVLAEEVWRRSERVGKDGSRRQCSKSMMRMRRRKEGYSCSLDW